MSTFWFYDCGARVATDVECHWTQNGGHVCPSLFSSEFLLHVLNKIRRKLVYRHRILEGCTQTCPACKEIGFVQDRTIAKNETVYIRLV